MSIFKVYTQNLCNFECRLKVARQVKLCLYMLGHQCQKLWFN